MFSRIFLITLTICVLLIRKSKNDIPNCLFVNTEVVTNASLILSNNNTEMAIYNYNISSDGNITSVEPHIRRCICPDPCLTMCSKELLDNYNELDEMKPAFQKIVILQNGDNETKDVATFFNHRFLMPCESMYSLLMETNSNDDWSIYENGTLLLHFSNTTFNQEKYCFGWRDIEDDGTVFVPYLCTLNNGVYYHKLIRDGAMATSVLFLLLTIIYYCKRSKLRNSPDKCIVMYLLNITLNYTVIIYYNFAPKTFEYIECVTIGYVMYFCTIGFLTWLSIISNDTFATLVNNRNSELFGKFFLIGLAIPLATTLAVYVIQQKNGVSELNPGIEKGSCAIDTRRWSAMLYYYIPHIIVLLYCSILYIKLVRFFITHEKALTTRTGRMKTSNKKRFSIYFRLFFHMGITWFAELLSYFISMINESDSILTLILDAFSALHGVFLYYSMVCHSIKKRSNRNRSARHELMTTASMVETIDED